MNFSNSLSATQDGFTAHLVALDRSEERHTAVVVLALARPRSIVQTHESWHIRVAEALPALAFYHHRNCLES
jgi:hypothetical protein